MTVERMIEAELRAWLHQRDVYDVDYDLPSFARYLARRVKIESDVPEVEPRTLLKPAPPRREPPTGS